MKRKAILISIIAAMGIVFYGCGSEAAPQAAPEGNIAEEMAVEETSDDDERVFPEGKVTILYTNDVHTYINNTATDEGKNVTELISYGSIAALKNDLEAAGENVILVDAGDHSQGTAYGAMDEGKNIIKIMNAAGYQVATPGNHEFDYGQFRAFEIFDEADFDYVSCNFYDLTNDKPALLPYKIIDAGGVKVAFVGVTTPDTFTSGTPTYFQDEKGNYIYDFMQDESGAKLYNQVQSVLDEIKTSGEADYIVGLGHLGVDQSSRPYTSEELIKNTEGFDAFIDGHSHTLMPCKKVTDKAGNDVVLTQTGCYFANIGKMTLDNGQISTELISEYENVDATVDAMVKEWVDTVENQLGENIAVLENDMYVTNPNGGERLVRRSETSMGDFVADSIYYYFNEVEKLDCDIAIVNGGGVRADVPAGDISYKTCKTVQPFGNVVCLVEVTGQQVMDMLEFGSRLVGVTGDEGQPAEFGGFLQVAGLTYTIDTTIEYSGTEDDKEVWTSGPSGEYRVSNVKIYNKETGEYDDLDLNKTYAMGGINYILRNEGNGYGMLRDCTLIKDYVGEDYLIEAEYFKSFASGDDGMPHVKTENSPLACYEGYKMNYENALGAERILIVVE